MHRLILLRHAKTEATAESGGDIERGLTERGRRDAALVGRALAGAGLAPDRVLVSTARRAQETWRAMAEAFPGASIDDLHGLYLAGPDTIARIVEDSRAEHADATVMVVGHNPGLHEHALALLGGQGGPAEARQALAGGFPTAAAAVFAVDEAGRARLEQLILPRDIGGGVR
jgi:phosphohistidine phosphatase